MKWTGCLLVCLLPPGSLILLLGFTEDRGVLLWEGSSPAALKESLLLPLLEKSFLDPTVLENYSAVSSFP